MYFVHATSCEGSLDSWLCTSCRQLSPSLASINHQVMKHMMIHPNIQIMAASLWLMGPDIAATAVLVICEKKDGQILNLEKKIPILFWWMPNWLRELIPVEHGQRADAPLAGQNHPTHRLVLE